jgi:hypothetical protein
VSLAVGQYASIDPAPDSGCMVFPANGAVDAEYLVIAQLATGDTGKTSSFRLTGDTIRPVMLPPLGGGASLTEERLSPAERFHTFLRRGDETRWRSLVPLAGAKAPLPTPAAGPPTYGAPRQFRVCARLNCSLFSTVTATARAVKNRVAIFVDNAGPAFGGLDSAALDSLGSLFDSRLYATDTAAFGRESDIDANTVVMVLMTPVVNKLVTSAECQRSGFVAGFFYGADLLPQLPNSNAGEIFYSFVADPSGTLSCSHSGSSVKNIVPVTFIHEFQHMISFNQHALVRGGDGEVLWLNEGFSHYAEELGGWTFGPGTPEFSRFVIGDLYNAYQYLDSTGGHFLLPRSGIGSLAERGAAWLFVRYIVDRYSGGTTIAAWNAFTRQLLLTSNTGAANVAAVTGDPFDTVVTRWAFANWVSDVPAFTPPAELTYETWAFRTTYASLNAQDPTNFPKPYPLTPTQSAGRFVDLTGTLRAGSGVYHRATQSALAPGFTLQFSTAGGSPLSPALTPRLNVIRIK